MGLSFLCRKVNTILKSNEKQKIKKENMIRKEYKNTHFDIVRLPEMAEHFMKKLGDSKNGTQL